MMTMTMTTTRMTRTTDPTKIQGERANADIQHKKKDVYVYRYV